MVRSNRRLRRTRRRPGVRTTTLMRRIGNADCGVSITPPIDPPSYASAPWWPITVVVIQDKATTYKWDTIHAVLIKSLALDKFVSAGKAPGFNMRILSVRAWGVDRQPITLDVYSIASSSCHKIKQLVDMGTTINYSRLGWKYGRSSFAKLDVGCPAATTSIFGVDASGKVTVYISLLIQREGVPGSVSEAVPNVDNPWQMV